MPGIATTFGPVSGTSLTSDDRVQLVLAGACGTDGMDPAVYSGSPLTVDDTNLEVTMPYWF